MEVTVEVWDKRQGVAARESCRTLFSRYTHSFPGSKARVRVADLMKCKEACSAALHVCLLHPPDPVILQPCFKPNSKHGVMSTVSLHTRSV